MFGSGASPPSAQSDGFEVVVFRLEDRTLALALSGVERVVRMVAATPLPAAPAAVAGVVDAGGVTLPVFDPRVRFGLRSREPRPSDVLIVARSATRRLALWVDELEGLQQVASAAYEPADSILPDLPHVAGIVRIPGHEVILIQDLDRFLSPAEDAQLESALQHHEG